MTGLELTPAEASELAAMYEELKPIVLGCARKLAGDRQLADDLAMEAFTAAAARWGDVRCYARDVQVLWLTTVVTRRWIDGQRRGATAIKHQPELWQQHWQSDVGPEALAQLRLLIDDFTKEIEAMPARQRSVAKLKWYFGLANTEIAKKLGMTQGTVSAHVAAARARLRIVLDKHRLDNPDLPEGGRGV